MCAVDVRPAIGTDRLILRGVTRADAGAIAELANDLGVSGNVATMPYPYRPADALAFIAGTERADPRAHAEFAIEHRQFGLVGMLGFHEKEPPAIGSPMADSSQESRSLRERGRAEVGYWLGRPFWNRGYATEALTAALRWVKFDWRRHVVWGGHFADNRASGQVLVKAGFLYTGDVEWRMSEARAEPAPTRMMVWLA
ncbi:GNAT family N-acetyltransferase [Phenylobacterium sp.]|uniref:GNAT family N-acetyltransferase n=1 Tax=Phenylobacterium sp. TaxID=1871053 RepID=UPI002EDAF37C